MGRNDHAPTAAVGLADLPLLGIGVVERPQAHVGTIGRACAGNVQTKDHVVKRNDLVRAGRNRGHGGSLKARALRSRAVGVPQAHVDTGLLLSVGNVNGFAADSGTKDVAAARVLLYRPGLSLVPSLGGVDLDVGAIGIAGVHKVERLFGVAVNELVEARGAVVFHAPPLRRRVVARPGPHVAAI